MTDQQDTTSRDALLVTAVGVGVVVAGPGGVRRHGGARPRRDLLTAPALAAAYAATVLRAAPGGRRIAAALAPAGRMALTNYLTPSLVCALVFTGLGIGLVGRLAPLPVQLVTLALFAAQLAVSAWWLRRHRYGPLEWLLRAITLAAVPPWR